MKNWKLLLALAFATQTALAGTIADDNLDLGKPTSSSTKSVTFKGPTKKKLSSTSAGTLGYDGNTLSLGDGAASDKSIQLNNGGTPPTLRFNNTSGATEFFNISTLSHLGNTFQLGDSAASDKSLIFKTNAGSPPTLKWNNTNSALETANVSTLSHTGNTMSLGDGAASNKTLKFNKGASSPEIRYNNTLGKLEFSNDASTYKAIGSGGGGGGGVNLLQDSNSDFETALTNWTASGGSLTSETSSPLFDLSSGKFNSSATSQTVTSAAIAIKQGFIGQKCEAEIYYRYASGSAGDYTFNVIQDASTNIASTNFLVTGANTQKAQLFFDCPSSTSNTLKLQIASTADAGDLIVDNAFVGTGKNILQLSQAEIYGVTSIVAGVASCSMNTTSGTTADIPTNSNCTPGISVQGNATVVAGDFRLRVPSLPPGRYEVTANLPFRAQNSAGTLCEIYMNVTPVGSVAYGQSAQQGASADADLAGYNLNGAFTNSTAQGQTDVSFGWRRVGGTGACQLNFASTGGPSTIVLKRFPLTSSEALNLDTSGWFVDATVAGANPAMSTGSVSSYSPIESSTLSISANAGSLPVQIPCSSGNASTGTTCAAGNEAVGVVFNLPMAGQVVACASYGVEISTGAGGSWDGAMQIVETPNTANTLSQEGKSRVPLQNRQPSSIVNQPVRLCGTFNFSSAGQKTLRLMYESSVSGTVNNSIILADQSGAQGQRDVHWEIYPINQQMPAPVFTTVQKKVESNASGERIERARVGGATTTTVCSSSPCTIHSQSGSWLTGCTRAGTGNYTCSVTAGTFSAAPSCTFMAAGAVGFASSAPNVAQSSTAITVQTGYNLTNADTYWDMICMGPK